MKCIIQLVKKHIRVQCTTQTGTGLHYCLTHQYEMVNKFGMQKNMSTHMQHLYTNTIFICDNPLKVLHFKQQDAKLLGQPPSR